jgi:hypothetical protein
MDARAVQDLRVALRCSRFVLVSKLFNFDFCFLWGLRFCRQPDPAPVAPPPLSPSVYDTPPAAAAGPPEIPPPFHPQEPRPPFDSALRPILRQEEFNLLQENLDVAPRMRLCFQTIFQNSNFTHCAGPFCFIGDWSGDRALKGWQCAPSGQCFVSIHLRFCLSVLCEQVSRRGGRWCSAAQSLV